MGIIFFIGRLLFGGYFLYNAFKHFKHHQGYIAYATAKKVPFPKISIFGSGALLALGGLSIVFGYQMALGFWLLLIFMVPVTIMMHPFWKEAVPEQKSAEAIAFFKNIAIIGALLMFIAIASVA